MFGGTQECGGRVQPMCGGQRLTLSDSLDHSPLYTLRQGLSFNPELGDSLGSSLLSASTPRTHPHVRGLWAPKLQSTRWYGKCFRA